MSPFDWFLPAPKVRPPLLLRLDLGGVPCPASVEVDTEWLPTRARATGRYLSASSMVLVPWRSDASTVRVRVRIGDEVGDATVTREENRDGEVITIGMSSASAAHRP
jgi:hypothetical protein